MPGLNLNIKSPNGWNKWVYPRTTVSGIQLPDAPFPILYTPSKAFWLRSIINHCLIPWIQTYDPFTTFLIAGGATATSMGSVSGLNAVADTFEIFIAGCTFGLTGKAVGPKFGFCINNIFKQQIYVRMDIQNVIGGVDLLSTVIELFENSRFKRIYVHHGEIIGYSKENDQNILTLDIDSVFPPHNASQIVGDKITVFKSDGSSCDLDILGINTNWKLIVSDPPENIVPSIGDFYKLNSIWLINDPYLMSGFWMNSEEQNPGFTSGFNLFVTDQNKPYQEGKILGIYLWKKISVTDLSNVSTTSTTTLISGFQPIYGTNMRDSGGYEWAFYGLGNSQDSSDIYTDDTRYKEVVLDIPDEDGATIKYEKRSQADLLDYDAVMANSDTSYLRIEIGTGGYYTRHNWYSSCLTNSYITINNNSYKILAQVDASTIDVSIKSVDGKSILNVIQNQSYSIFNQYAWMISEDYFQKVSDKSHVGMFEGTVVDVYSDFKKIMLKADKMTDVATLKKNNLSLEDRYIQQVPVPGNMRFLFKKQNGWKFVVENDNYDISSVIFKDLNSDGTREIEIELENSIYKTINTRGYIPINSRGYIIAGPAFNTTNNISEKSGYTMSLSAAGGLAGDTTGFIISNVLCVDGEYFSNPYLLDIPYDSRIGICEGYLFGMEINGSASSRIGAVMLVTTPRAYRGLASLFNFLRQEDWVAFQDPITQRIVIRRGSLNFTDYPMKNMIVIGRDVLNEEITGGTSISLNTNQDWLRRIQFPLPDADQKSKLGVTFGISDVKNIYGFYVSGQGKINLQLLKREGLSQSQLPINLYRGYGYNVSPVYLYLRNFYENLENNFVDIGIKTTDGPIYFRLEDGTSNVNTIGIFNVIAQYVQDSQTLENIDYYDLIKTENGENFFIYGTSVGSFKIGSKLNNSKDNGKKWNNSNVVMIIGSYDEDFTWVAPMTHGENQNNRNQYALMVLNSVDYMSFIYNPLNNTLSLFVRAFSNNAYYIGCLTISLINLKKPNYLCVPTTSFVRNFLWRPPSLSDEFISDSKRSWTDFSNIIDDDYSYKPDEENGTEDKYVRIMGSGSTNSKIVNVNETGIISTHLLPDGTYALFYDSNAGIRALFSNDCGGTWYQSDMVYAKEARSACLIGRYLFYITTSGIEVKLTNYYDFYRGLSIAMEKKAGNDINIFEQNTQELLDNLDHVLIGSGKIESQRLSGYITYDGIIKIFYYDNNNLLRCMESKDSLKWNMADNF